MPSEQLPDLLRSYIGREPVLAQFNAHFLHFAQHVPGCDEAFWCLLREWVDGLLSRTDRPTFISQVSAQAKVLCTLIELDRRTDAESFVVDFGLDLNRFRTSLTDEGVVAQLPGFGLLPEELFRLTESQLTVRAKVLSTRWDRGRVTVDGFAYIAHVDLTTTDTQIAVALVSPDGVTTPLLTEAVVDPRIDELSKHYFADFRSAGFQATSSSPIPEGELSVVVSVVTAGLERSSRIQRLARPPSGTTQQTLCAISHDDNVLELEFDGLIPSEVLLVSPRLTLTADIAGVARIDLDLEGLAPPTGTYQLVVRDTTGSMITAWPREESDLLTPLARVRTMDHEGGAAFRISAPLRVDERGNRNQQRLRDAARVPRADRDAVFFRALYGEVANCNGRAVHHELRRRDTPLQLYWSVRDRSVRVPDGGVAIIEGSREWHAAIATARYQMINVHQMDWFVKPEGQVMIQTMHGYPYKVMGHAHWAQSRFAAAHVARFDRRAREWDYLVSPARYATPLLRAAFLTPARASPTILEIGYPRNDELVTATSQDRQRARHELGLQPHQTVVLYAPTFRDYVAVNDLKAEAVAFFDASAAARELGSEYVFLMRGHPFNARTDQRNESSSTVIDVTDHPDINELCLASDAAILDYSSLRFDYALTNKPMVFLVPDLELWHDRRGGVIDYAPTAPGPKVTTQREVVDELRDLDRLAHDWQDARTMFKQSYVDMDDGAASERLVDAVFGPRGDA